MAGSSVVTGIKQIDRKLQELEPAIQRKIARRALRDGGKLVAKAAQEIIEAEALDTGSLYESVKVKSLPRSKNKIGISILPPRDLLFANYEATHGKMPNPEKGESAPHYYAADIEFGNDNQPAIKPFRRALYDNEQQIVSEFQEDVKDLIAKQQK